MQNKIVIHVAEFRRVGTTITNEHYIQK